MITVADGRESLGEKGRQAWWQLVSAERRGGWALESVFRTRGWSQIGSASVHIKVEVQSHEIKRKANTRFTQVPGAAVSIYVSRILPQEDPSYQFCKLLPLSPKV